MHSMTSPLSFIDLGPLSAFKRRLKALQARVSGRWFRFYEMEGHAGFWLFEDEDEEDIVGGVLHVSQGRVYAISRDVADLVSESFGRA